MENLKRWILHPFLFGIYPVIALLAYNIKQIGPMFAIRPTLIALILSCLFLLFFQLIFRNWQKAALAATLSVLLFFTYGHVYNLIHNIYGIGFFGKNRFLAVLWVILFAAGIWFIAKKIKAPAAWTRSFNILSIALLGFSLIQIAFHEARSFSAYQHRQSVGSSSVASRLNPQPEGNLPDIYYIILDTYTRSDALQQAFKYDNSSFLAALEKKGFFAASCSQSNYNSTEPSLASSLNMNYLENLNAQFSSPNSNMEDVVPYLQDNAVRQTLKDLGYKFVALESGFPPTEFRDADIYLSPQADLQNLRLTGGLTAFEAILFRTTIGGFFYDTRFFPNALKNSLFDNAYLLHRNRILYELDKLAEMPALLGPKFVFVHILAPHNPFVFGPNGEILHRNTPFTLNNDQDALQLQDYIAGYNNQVNYLDTRVLEIIDKILAGTSTPPIIIIQGDHGSPRTPDWRTAILNVYYLPGHEAALYPSITPVNSFRIIFDQYFGGNLPLLPDRSCRSSLADPFNCTYLPDPNPQCAVPEEP